MKPEQIITDFMRRNYSDERLVQLLEHAESGKLSYISCCCFIGVANADHALKGELVSGAFNSEFGDHLFAARFLPGGFNAERAYQELGEGDYMTVLAEAMSNGKDAPPDRDSYRRERLIPLIRAEISRRESSRSQTEVSEMVVV